MKKICFIILCLLFVFGCSTKEMGGRAYGGIKSDPDVEDYGENLVFSIGVAIQSLSNWEYENCDSYVGDNGKYVECEKEDSKKTFGHVNLKLRGRNSVKDIKGREVAFYMREVVSDERVDFVFYDRKDNLRLTAEMYVDSEKNRFYDANGEEMYENDWFDLFYHYAREIGRDFLNAV